jgi:hypothetical protein
MNNSNAAAKRRRAGIITNTPQTPSQPSTPQSNAPSASTQGLTLPQVIAVIDTRLITLEKFMKDTTNGDATASSTEDNADQSQVFMDSKEFTEFVEEVNQRFQVVADEINNMKEILLKLQGFTMDVNKMLLASVVKSGDSLPNITFDLDEKKTDTTSEPQTFSLAPFQE